MFVFSQSLLSSNMLNFYNSELIKEKKEAPYAGYDFLEFVHCELVITHIAPKFLISGIT